LVHLPSRKRRVLAKRLRLSRCKCATNIFYLFYLFTYIYSLVKQFILARFFFFLFSLLERLVLFCNIIVEGAPPCPLSCAIAILRRASASNRSASLRYLGVRRRVSRSSLQAICHNDV
jgi:hypothetical protein